MYAADIMENIIGDPKTRLIDDGLDWDAPRRGEMEGRHSMYSEKTSEKTETGEEEEVYIFSEGKAADGPDESATRNIKLIIDELMSFDEVQSNFVGNQITTQKYDKLTFLPKNLYEQFHRLANIWFLMVCILQLSTPYSPSLPYATLVPFMGVIITAAVKDAVEDYRRYLMDIATNSKECYIVAKTQLEKESGDIQAIFPVLRRMSWANIRVGHIVYLEGDQPIPADMLLLSSSDAENGSAYVETSQLDGESNLKIKNALHDTKHDRTLDAIIKLSGMTITCELPNPNLERFYGTCRTVGTIRPIPADMKNFLVRGSALRNTEFTYAAVVYTGHETRLFQNSSAAATKKSKIEGRINRYLCFVFLLMFNLIVWSFILAENFKAKKFSQWEFYHVSTMPKWLGAASRWIVFLILYNNLVPLSLYITLDLVRAGQAWFISRDPNCFHWNAKDTSSTTNIKGSMRLEKDQEAITAVCRTSALNDDLGQIDYVFSDKTGTLTENEMIFRVCSAGGKIFGKTQLLSPGGMEEPGAAGARSAAASSSVGSAAEGIGTVVPTGPSDSTKLGRRKSKEAPPNLDIFAYHVSDVTQDLLHFLECVLLCHIATPVKVRNSKELMQRFIRNAMPFEVGATPAIHAHAKKRTSQKGITIQDLEEQYRVEASSPDEEALLLGIGALGYKVLERTSLELSVLKNGVLERWEILGQHEFTSERKRMSIVLRQITNRYYRPGVTLGPGVDKRKEDETNCAVSSPGASGTTAGAGAAAAAIRNVPPTPAANAGGAAVVGSVGAGAVGNTGSAAPEVEDYQLESGKPGQVIMFIKGADTVLFERMAAKKTTKATLEGIKEHVSSFGVVGLRTLVMGRRLLTSSEAEDYMRKYEKAKTALFGREEQLELVAEQFERKLSLLGCSGLEDRIQAGVCESIHTILDAGIKLWMLTGDKQETAINVGYTISLLKRHYTIFIVNVSGTKDPTDRFLEVCREVKEWELRHPKKEYGLVVDGPSLSLLLGKNYTILENLVRLSASASAVVACRITPRQKSALVNLIKLNLKPIPMTLSIGDGANDVAMIRTAHVGVGITGNEGRQAVSASDYSIGQFRFLVNLLFCHGRRNYNRIAIVILFSFFKNIAMIIPLFLYNFYNGFSGNILYESFLMMTYNLFWTSVPICVVGILDYDLPDLVNLHIPMLYQQGRFGESFSSWIFVRWMVEAIIVGMVLFYFFVNDFADGALAGDAMNLDWIALGSTSYYSVILCVNFKLLINTCEKSRLFMLTTGVILIYVPYIFLFEHVLLHVVKAVIGQGSSRAMYVHEGATQYVWGAARTWFAVILSSGLYFTIEYFFNTIVTGIFRVVSPTPVSKVANFLVSEMDRGFAKKSRDISPDGQELLRKLQNDTRKMHSSTVSRNSASVESIKKVVPDNNDDDDGRQEESGGQEGEESPSPPNNVDPYHARSFLELYSKLQKIHLVEEFELKGKPFAMKDLMKSEDHGGFSHKVFSIFFHRGHHHQFGGNQSVNNINNMGSSTSEKRFSNNTPVSGKKDDAKVKQEAAFDLQIQSRLTLYFKDEVYERQYRQEFVRKNIGSARLVYVVGVVVCIMYGLYILTSTASSEGSSSFSFFMVSILVLAIWGATYTHYYLVHFIFLQTFIGGSFVVFKTSYDANNRSDGALFTALYPMVFITLLKVPFFRAFTLNICTLMLFAFRYVVVNAQNTSAYIAYQERECVWPLSQLCFLVDYLPYIAGITILFSFLGYRQEYYQRRQFDLQTELEKAQLRNQEILHNILPSFVVEKMLREGEDGAIIAEDIGVVTVIFCDIQDFSELVIQLEDPQRLVQLLDTLFKRYDRLAEKHFITKIETVGETFLSAGGLQRYVDEKEAQVERPQEKKEKKMVENIEEEEDSPKRREETEAEYQRSCEDAYKSLLFAIDQLKGSSNLYVTENENGVQFLKVKIGLNSGPVIAGCVGARKPQYALFGDTVNTASRMKGKSQTDKINMSNNTFDRICYTRGGRANVDAEYNFEERELEVKGKGLMKTYLLHGLVQKKKDDDRHSSPTGHRHGHSSPTHLHAANAHAAHAHDHGGGGHTDSGSKEKEGEEEEMPAFLVVSLKNGKVVVESDGNQIKPLPETQQPTRSASMRSTRTKKGGCCGGCCTICWYTIQEFITAKTQSVYDFIELKQNKSFRYIISRREPSMVKAVPREKHVSQEDEESSDIFGSWLVFSDFSMEDTFCQHFANDKTRFEELKRFIGLFLFFYSAATFVYLTIDQTPKLNKGALVICRGIIFGFGCALWYTLNRVINENDWDGERKAASDSSNTLTVSDFRRSRQDHDDDEENSGSKAHSKEKKSNSKKKMGVVVPLEGYHQQESPKSAQVESSGHYQHPSDPFVPMNSFASINSVSGGDTMGFSNSFPSAGGENRDKTSYKGNILLNNSIFLPSGLTSDQNVVVNVQQNVVNYNTPPPPGMYPTRQPGMHPNNAPTGMHPIMHPSAHPNYSCTGHPKNHASTGSTAPTAFYDGQHKSRDPNESPSSLATPNHIETLLPKISKLSDGKSIHLEGEHSMNEGGEHTESNLPASGEGGVPPITVYGQPPPGEVVKTPIGTQKTRVADPPADASATAKADGTSGNGGNLAGSAPTLADFDPPDSGIADTTPNVAVGVGMVDAGTILQDNAAEPHIPAPSPPAVPPLPVERAPPQAQPPAEYGEAEKTKRVADSVADALFEATTSKSVPDGDNAHHPDGDANLNSGPMIMPVVNAPSAPVEAVINTIEFQTSTNPAALAGDAGAVGAPTCGEVPAAPAVPATPSSVGGLATPVTPEETALFNSPQARAEFFEFLNYQAPKAQKKRATQKMTTLPNLKENVKMNMDMLDVEGVFEGPIGLWDAAKVRYQQQTSQPTAPMVTKLFLYYFLGHIAQIFIPLYVCDNPEDQWITYSSSLEILYWICLMNSCTGLMTFPVLVFAYVFSSCFLAFIVMGFPNVFFIRTTSSYRMELFGFTTLCASLALFGGYNREKFARMVFHKMLELTKMDKRSELLLSEMLPAHVLQTFRQGGAATLKVVREYSDMTCLFADISGFTAYSKTVNAFKVVKLVARLFAAIDDLSRRVGIYKVCTIGDCYVATLEPESGADNSEEKRLDHCIIGCSDMMKFAAGLIFLVSGIREELQIEGLGMRVGLHLATFVGGVIGTRKLRYDIWGADVLITNKMEENGIPGRICVSEKLKDFMSLYFRKRFVWVKHKFVEEYKMWSYRLTQDLGLVW